jgi:DNA polymerase-4
MAVLRGFTGVVVEVVGWDEAFVGATVADAAAAEELAQRIQAAVVAETRLTCAVGIGDNLLRAKIATEFGKPGGRFTLTGENWVEVMGHRPTRALWGIGAKTAAKLAERGLTTVDELAAADPEALAAELGPALGPWYVQLGRGIGRAEVRGEPWVARSHGREETFPADLTDWADVRAAAVTLAHRVAEDVRAEGRPAARVGVKVRFAPFTTKTRSMTLPEPTSDTATLEAAALEVLERFHPGRPVRLVGVRAELAATPPPPRR